MEIVQSADAATGSSPAAPEVPEQCVPAPVPVDHVRKHATGCYWDFRECRWRCAGG
jgi:hypothetical protein